MLQSESPVISVSQAITICNGILQDLPMKIEGEVANLSISRGKFVFFDLKDEHAESRVGCFMMAFNLTSPLEDGMRVLIQGKPGLYQKNGGFRITVNRVEPRGSGSLKRSFELLKKKLTEEGLFDSERKRSLPRFSQSVGIISSKDAAGFGDFKNIVNSRLKGISYYFVSVAVQGVDAEAEICQAFDHLNSYYDLDCIVLIRGGGSMEDLHAFNSELVARAIVRSKAPVLVGVGHERDVTIADYCADVRASTPSNAAQLVVPTSEEVKNQVKGLIYRGDGIIKTKLAQNKQTVIHINEIIHDRLSGYLQDRKIRVSHILKTITATSPLTLLKRGFSIVRNEKGELVSSEKMVSAGDIIHIQVSDGAFDSVIT